MPAQVPALKSLNHKSTQIMAQPAQADAKSCTIASKWGSSAQLDKLDRVAFVTQGFDQIINLLRIARFALDIGDQPLGG